MRFTALSEKDIRSLMRAALDLGIDVFDHADVCGEQAHDCERRFGDAVTLSSEERAAITVQSKAGTRSGNWDFSQEHILLGTSCPRTTVAGRLSTASGQPETLLRCRPSQLRFRRTGRPNATRDSAATHAGGTRPSQSWAARST